VWLKKNGREQPPVQLIKEFYSISAEEIPFHGQKNGTLSGYSPTMFFTYLLTGLILKTI
jgi:hypothetical protein